MSILTRIAIRASYKGYVNVDSKTRQIESLDCLLSQSRSSLPSLHSTKPLHRSMIDLVHSPLSQTKPTHCAADVGKKRLIVLEKKDFFVLIINSQALCRVTANVSSIKMEQRVFFIFLRLQTENQLSEDEKHQ